MYHKIRKKRQIRQVTMHSLKCDLLAWLSWPQFFSRFLAFFFRLPPWRPWYQLLRLLNGSIATCFRWHRILQAHTNTFHANLYRNEKLGSLYNTQQHCLLSGAFAPCACAVRQRSQRILVANSLKKHSHHWPPTPPQPLTLGATNLKV